MLERPSILQLDSVTREFSVRKGLFAEQAHLLAVDTVTLDIASGETLGLVGESGCGKSTLGRMAVGLLPPSSGTVLLEGQSLYDKKNAASVAGHIQMVFQDPFSSLNPRLSVERSIAEPLTVQNIPKAERQERVNDMLKLVGLTAEQGKRFPHEFSGGQRQRIAVARALITDPKVLVCDEPVSALDASVQAQVLNLLREMQERFQLTSLFISHDLSVVGFMCDRIAVMYLGRLVEYATKHTLFASAAHPYTRALLASIPSLDPTEKSHIKLLSGELPSPLTPPSGCTFHPRCPQAMDVCRHETPLWTDKGQGHKVRCHLY